MTIPDIAKLQDAAREIVIQAKISKTLSALSPRSIRHQLEEKFGLEDGTLDASEYKKPIRAAIDAANDIDVDSDNEPDLPKMKKRKSEEMEAQSNSMDGSSYKSVDKEVDLNDEHDAPTINPKAKRHKPDELKEKKALKKSSAFRSASVVASSDIEQDEPLPPSHEIKFDDDDDTTPVKKHRISTASTINSKVSKHISVPTHGNKSDSELSVLIDEESVKTKRKRSTGSKKKADTKPKKKSESTTLSKDEESIKRLKGLVNACGVRKVWSKFFQNIDKSSQQIKMLKDLLNELGMSGRMSLEQARTIKEKREFEQELADVQSFEQSMNSRTKAPKIGESNDEESGNEEEEDSSSKPPPRKKANNTRSAIMAFLADQSDSD